MQVYFNGNDFFSNIKMTGILFFLQIHKGCSDEIINSSRIREYSIGIFKRRFYTFYNKYFVPLYSK